MAREFTTVCPKGLRSYSFGKTPNAEISALCLQFCCSQKASFGKTPTRQLEKRLGRGEGGALRHCPRALALQESQPKRGGFEPSP